MEMNHILIELLANITRLGDSIVLGVFSVVLSVYFLVIGYKRASLAILLSFVIPASIIGILKIAFYTCHTNLWGIVSPSGHAAISLGVLGVSAMILVNICTGIWRKLIPVALFLLAIVIAISRTILGMHTDGDVIVGGLIGGIVVFAIRKTINNREHLRRDSEAVAGVAVAKSANRASAGTQGDSLDACVARIPTEATAGQRLLAEESCKRDQFTHH